MNTAGSREWAGVCVMGWTDSVLGGGRINNGPPASYLIYLFIGVIYCIKKIEDHCTKCLSGTGVHLGYDWNQWKDVTMRRNCRRFVVFACVVLINIIEGAIAALNQHCCGRCGCYSATLQGPRRAPKGSQEGGTQTGNYKSYHPFTAQTHFETCWPQRPAHAQRRPACRLSNTSADWLRRRRREAECVKRSDGRSGGQMAERWSRALFKEQPQ